MPKGMEEQRVDYLLKAYAKDRLSPAEREELLHLIQSNADNETLGRDMQRLVDKLIEEGGVEEASSKQLWKAILDDPRLERKKNTRRIEKRNRLVFHYAATVAVFVTFLGLYFLHFQNQTNAINQQEAVLMSQTEQLDEVISPGTQQATLTLPDGKVISLADLTDGSLVNEKDYGLYVVDGVLQYKGNEDHAIPLMATLTTPRGGEYQMQLPDGTKVWLNASSSIRYPISFATDRREVYIEGEVYFDVESDTKNPFIVHADGTKITVLGTEFNVSAYSEEKHVRTTLVEGSVRLEKGSAIRQLRPGQQAQTSKGESEHIAVRSVDIEEMIAWKNGYFYFHNEDIKSAMEKIARWYDVDVAYSGAMSQKGLDGTISRMENLNQLLQALELTGTAKFTLEGRKITVSE